MGKDNFILNVLEVSYAKYLTLSKGT